ncbi:MAG: S1 RNA-binding domain-containing protein [Caldilineales bacterium]
MTSGDVEIAVETAAVESAADDAVAENASAQVETRAAKPAQKQKKKVRVLPRAKIVKVLSVGMEVTGTVKRVSEFGAFVDIGAGRDGLLHISELSTSRVHKVTDVVQEGQEVTVWIKELDRERNRISLSMISPDTKTIRDLEVGELVTGTVTRLTNYGAFVDIGLERDAMLHVKEMGDGYVAKPEDVVKQGEVIEARISGVDPRRGRIDLSLKGLRQAAPNDDASAEVYLEPVTVELEEEELPSAMEMAFRMALSEEDIEYEVERASRKNSRRRRNHYRDQQDDIVSRTLRYHN